MKLRSLLAASVTALCLSPLSLPHPASAQAYPTMPVKIVVPYPPGGAGDLHARMIGEKLAEKLGQPVLVENRSGASGNIGSEFVANAAPDGHTLLMNTTNLAIGRAVSSKLPFDVLTDLAPITPTLTSQNLLVVPNSLPVASVAELIAYAREHPGKLSYGSSGVGTPMLSIELLKVLAGVDIVHVPYRGDAPAITDLMGGQIQMYATNVLALQSYYRGGKVKALAVTGSKRAASLPEIPTMEEAGVAGYEIESWFGFFAPARTPRPVIDRLNAAIADIVAMPEIRQKMIDTGSQPVSMTPEAFRERIRADIDKFSRVIQSAGIKVE